MGLRDRLAAQAEINAAKVAAAAKAAATAREAGRPPGFETEQERKYKYLRGEIQPHLARWCTEMGIDSPTPEFTVVECTLPPLVVLFRFSIEDFIFEGYYRDTGHPITFFPYHQKLRRVGEEEMRITLPKHHRYVGYEINNLTDLARNLGAPEVRYSSMK